MQTANSLPVLVAVVDGEQLASRLAGLSWKVLFVPYLYISFTSPRPLLAPSIRL